MDERNKLSLIFYLWGDAVESAMDNPIEEGADESLSSAVANVENVLVMASAETDAGKRACFDLLDDRRPGETNILVISPTIGPDAWLDQWDDAHPGRRPNRLGYIAIGEVVRGGVAVSQSTAQMANPVEVKPVEHPGNLTEVGVAVTHFLTHWDVMHSSVSICLQSLEVLLENSDLESLFRFLHVLTGKMQTSGSHFHAHIDPAGLDNETVFTLMALFDIAIERDTGDEWKISGRHQLGGVG